MNALAAPAPANLPEINTDLPLSHFRLVQVHFEGQAGIVTHVVHASEVRRLLDALVELHHFPGINPHNGNPAARISEINVFFFKAGGPFWWSTPGLGTRQEMGATVVDTGMRTHRWCPTGGEKGTIWTAPGQ